MIGQIKARCFYLKIVDFVNLTNWRTFKISKLS